MKEHYLHFKALALKNLSLQAKRKANTCCQLFIPISVAILIGVAQLLSIDGNGGYFNDAETTWCTTGKIETILSADILYSNATGWDIGELTNKGNKSGFLGHIPQIRYDGSRMPFFTPGGSPDDIDDFFYAKLKQRHSCNENYCPFYHNGTAGVNFNVINISNSLLRMDYVVQSDYTDRLQLYPDYDDFVPRTGVYFINTLNNGLLQSVLGNNTGIATATTNMPYTEIGNPSLLGNVASLIFLPFGLSFLFSVYMYTIIEEKKEGLVQKMTACGLSMRTYWVVNYMYNYFLYLLISGTLFICGISFGIQVFRERTLELLILWLLWGTAQVSMCHFFTCFMSSPNAALIFGFLLSIFGSIAGLALEFFIFLPNPTVFPNFGYMVYPGFAFYHGFGLLMLSLIDPNIPKATLALGSYFSFMLLILLGHTFVFFVLTWYLEAVFPRNIGVRRHPLFPILALIEKCKRRKHEDNYDTEAASLISQKITKKQRKRKRKKERRKKKKEKKERKKERKKIKFDKRKAPLIIPVDQESANFSVNIVDDDVAREAEIVETVPDAMVRIIDLLKIYKGTNRNPKKLALNKVSLHIKKSECFGLLGPNGAGKTTLLNILSGVFPATSGMAFIGNFDIKTDMHKVHKFLGIVPQFDVLWNELTVREHLLFYFRLKANSDVNIKRHIKEIIEQVGLEEVENRPAAGLSGGQKRRLSIAIAMMGNPKLILMDEPTTGLDPSNRRALWDIVAKAKERHKAEVLCSRIGIMRKAKLHSIGTPMELKQKFGLGYNIKLSHFLNCEEKAHNFVMQLVPNAILVQAFGDLRSYKVMKGDFVLSELFKIMERNKHRYGIKEWSISQANLEEVFLAIVTEDEADSS